jgi:hypothetical protein
MGNSTMKQIAKMLLYAGCITGSFELVRRVCFFVHDLYGVEASIAAAAFLLLYISRGVEWCIQQLADEIPDDDEEGDTL